MPTTVEIRISGLALCYRANVNSPWIVDFLCDDNHRLFYHHSADPTDIRELGASNNIEIDVSDPLVAGAHQGAGFNNIFNMVKDAHTGGVVLVEPDLPGRHRVRMTIQHGALGTHKLTDKIYGIKKHAAPGDFKPLRNVAEIVGVIIRLKNTGSIVLKADNTPITLPDNKTGILSFDNDCRPLSDPACSNTNDSLLYYQLVAGSENPPVKYIFQRVKTVKGSSPKRYRSHPDGNCDPVSVEPPPGP